MDAGRGMTRDRNKKAHIELTHAGWDIKRCTSLNLPFTRSRKTKSVEVAAAEIQRINSVLVSVKCR